MRSRQNVETRLQLEQEASADRIAARLSSEFEQVADFADQLSMSSWIIKAGSRSDIMFRDLTILRKLEISRDLLLFESLLTSAFRIGVRIPHRELTILNNRWCNDASVLHEMRDKLENTDKLNAFLSRIDSTQAFSVVNLHQMLSGSDAVTDQNPNDLLVTIPLGNYRDDRTVRAVLFCCYSGDALLSEVISSSTYAPIGVEVFFQDEPILACGEVPEDVVWFERTCSQGFSMRIAYKSPNVLLGSNVWREVILPVVLICILTCAAAYVISMRIYVPIQILRSCITDRSGSDDFALLRSTYNRISDENIFLRAQINDLKRRNVELEEQLASMTDQPDKKESTDNSSELLGYVQNHFRDPQLSLTMLAEHFNCTPSVISRRFRKETGYNFLEYLGSLRIEQAKALIIHNPDISFDELAAVTGYGCERTFRRIFKTQTGLTPTVFAQQCRSGSYIVSELGHL